MPVKEAQQAKKMIFRVNYTICSRKIETIIFLIEGKRGILHEFSGK